LVLSQRIPPRLAAALGASLALAPAIAAAQPAASAPEHQGRAGLTSILTEFFTAVTNGTRGRVFDFFETVELWNAEGEVDRLVGNPWELHDSTSYKLRLLPLRLSYPVYGRLVSQMTRLDDLRGLRIQNVSPDSVDRLAVTFDTLDPSGRPEHLAGALLNTFSAREYADLGVFALSHQPFFPDTDERWALAKRRMGRNKYSLAGGALALGAAFNAGAFATSGNVWRSPDREYGVGWYAGVRQLGLRMQPQLRGGLTARAPGLELAAGLWERVLPDARDRRRAFELAVRESYLGRFARAAGWDGFVEAAFRGVLHEERAYAGERSTGRIGFFARKERPLRLRNIVFRSSTEWETDFSENTRFVVGLGFEHARTGLATILQSSRTAILRDGARTHESRGGLFLAGTVESPTQFVVDAMASEARLVRERLETLAALPAPTENELDDHLVPLAAALASYLEARRLAYSLLRWERTPNELHGPLDGDLLMEARRTVLARQQAVASFLREISGRLGASEKRAEELKGIVEREQGNAAIVDAYVAELDAIDRVRRREAERLGRALMAFEEYRTALTRMAAASPLVSPREVERLPPPQLRRLTAMAAGGGLR
jgi:hypothetical protein